ncbi:MAG: 2OG-Fe(II) oxygenase, partial [Bacillus sp. (in: firmicutes)]
TLTSFTFFYQSLLLGADVTSHSLTIVDLKCTFLRISLFEIGKKGYYKYTVRHGVSTITSGERNGLGIIFHDSK